MTIMNTETINAFFIFISSVTELFLFEKLTSDGEKMKKYWKQWREKSMSTKDFAKKSLSTLGKQLIKILVKVAPSFIP
jgi:hypothetical protein